MKKLKVLFRKDNDTGEILAIFPYIISTEIGEIMIECFSITDGHCKIDPYFIIKNTKHTTNSEYKYILSVLTDDYKYTNLQVINTFRFKSVLKSLYT